MNYLLLKKIGVLFGNTSSLWTDLTVLKNFELLKVIYEIDNKKFELKLKELVLAFKIEDLLKRTVKTLSLGQRMKCEIVACFLHSPEVIFLDEPSIGLDLNSKNTIRNFILNYSELNNITVILTSHDIFDIEEICNRLIIIDEGKIVLDDSINNIKNKYITKKCIKITSSEKNIKWNHHHTKVISIKPYESLIEVNTDEISLKDVIIKIFDSTAILDISIISQSLESIIKNIYSKQND
jgi:ABC-2 type transport system ATP-binding protein